ncbi:MAG: 4-hydroxythreonine-4-phosphate dehydrogenase PdxA [Alphaproteobacteria bacterium]|jgi:4-hydroxythreonine-4-phosphate dehydrogenase|nr:MAG: 4-hydroxythreonine-4-phosphate dehydrogenase PdxA [Alphaproteobacteria bacterium]
MPAESSLLPPAQLPLAQLPLAMTMGDPAGVGPIISFKAYDAVRAQGGRPFYVIAPRAVMEAVGPNTVIIRDPSEAIAAFGEALPVLNIPGFPATAGKPDPSTAPAVIESIRLAVEHTRSGQAAGVVTNPIAKALLYRAGFKHPGHTEYLAELAAIKGKKAPRPVMMLIGGGLRVALVTIHRPLASVVKSLTTDLIVDIGRIVHHDLQRDFGIAHPRIGLCGVNPHAGEDGEIGREEIQIINPAAVKLRAMSVDISDARPGDTIFHEALGGRYDAVIAMYHDQGLIPVKTLDMWGGVNVTLGLPFIRTSPDHGVAYDAAAAGIAKPDSLIAAVKLADQMAHAYARAQ